MSGSGPASESFVFRPVGFIKTAFREKFGIPRQSGLVEEALGRLELVAPYDRPEAFRHLERFSHVWLLWVAHKATGDPSSLMVRPPRLGGNRRVGVFASRSPFRPNAIGLSAVRLLAVEADAVPPALKLAGVDLLDGTPILDIKPYLAYSDAIPDAEGGFAPFAPAKALTVSFSAAAEAFLSEYPEGERLRTLVEHLLELDPRPAYREARGGAYAFRLEDVDVRWRVYGSGVEVTEFSRVAGDAT